MKKSILLLCGGLCLLAFLSINTSIRHTQEGIDTKLIYLNQKALADGEGGDHNFCENDLGDTCTTYGVTIQDCDETWKFWVGCAGE